MWAACSVELDGVDLAALPEARLTKVRAESIGFVFQSFNLIPTLSAQENAETALVPLGLGAADRRERAADALAIARKAPRRLIGPGNRQLITSDALLSRCSTLGNTSSSRGGSPFDLQGETCAEK